MDKDSLLETVASHKLVWTRFSISTWDENTVLLIQDLVLNSRNMRVRGNHETAKQAGVSIDENTFILTNEHVNQKEI